MADRKPARFGGRRLAFLPVGVGSPIKELARDLFFGVLVPRPAGHVVRGSRRVVFHLKGSRT